MHYVILGLIGGMKVSNVKKEGYDYAKQQFEAGKSLEKLEMEFESGIAFGVSDFDRGIQQFLKEKRTDSQ